MLCVCVGDVMFYFLIVGRGAASARVCQVRVFRHADIVCLCLVCIMWQFSMLRSARLAVSSCWSRMQEVTYERGIGYSRVGLMTALGALPWLV